MELSDYFRAVLEEDHSHVVICDLNHTILYMNPAAIRRYEKRGGASLIGRSLLDCHDPASREAIARVIRWFQKSPENNRVFTFHNEKENRDVYMIALRDADGTLQGYYEKHEFRDPETAARYQLD